MSKLLEIIGRMDPAEVPEGFVEEVKARISDEKENVWKRLCSLLHTSPEVGETDVLRKETVRKMSVVLLAEDDLSWRVRVEWCQTPEDFRAFFIALGLTEEEWRSSGAMGKKEGTGLQMLARNLKERFGSHKDFVAWMDAKKREPNMVERVRGCLKPADFLALFAELGIPGERWKKAGWLLRGAMLPPEEGGVGKSLSMLRQAILKDPRFEKSYPKFLGWMQKKDEPIFTFAKQVREAVTRDDFLKIFRDAGVPDDEWRNGTWMQRGYKETKGVSQGLRGAYAAITGDDRFKGWPLFVAFMDGYPLEGFSSREEAVALLKKESERLGVSLEQLLESPETAQSYFRQSPALKMIIEYLGQQSDQ